MTRKNIPPTVTVTAERGGHTERHEHPAYGLAVVHRYTRGVGGATLNGSALKHHNTIAITVHNSVMDRHLNNDWHFPREVLVEFEMSEAQWASLVSSIGMGGGVPVTLRYKPVDGYKLMEVPSIHAKSVRQQFAAEIERKSSEYIEDSKRLIGELEQLLNTDKAVPKGKLREIVRDLAISFGNLPGNMRFVQEQFDEAMDKTVQAGKAEIERFTLDTLVRAGLKHLSGEVSPPQIEEKKS